MAIRSRWSGCVWVVLGAITAACSSDAPAAAGPAMPHFNDISSAPTKIQSAANAVVRIHTAVGYGTGSFISSTGLLMTNNHVLGDTMCPIEGCYLEITKMRQRGQTKSDPSTVFAVPTAVDVGLDMAVAQLYSQPGGTKLDTPDYLQFNQKNSSELLGMHVTAVGHPEGCLKKWTDGSVVDATGEWFIFTAYALPGDSGSPVLDDDGRIVGLLHRGPTSEDLFTDNGVNTYSVGTASAPVSAALSDPLPSTMLSINATTTADDFVTNNEVYRNAAVSTADIGGTSTSALTLLGNACDAALARSDFKSPEDMADALAPCDDAQAWIECRGDSSGKLYGTLCPDSADLSKWVSRNQTVNQMWENMNGTFDYAAVSFNIAALQSNKSAGTTAGAQSLQQALDAAHPHLDFTLAYYLAAFGINSYDGTNIHDYVVNYAKVPHYELSAELIAYAATWLYGNGYLSSSALLSLEKKLNDDPKVSIGSQLAIEDFLYEIGEL